MTVGVKVYRFHRCDRRHREWWTLARCIWPKAEWITRDGPFASVSLCGGFVLRRQVGPTIVLFPTEAVALSAKQFIDTYGCGGRCWGRHESSGWSGAPHEVFGGSSTSAARPGADGVSKRAQRGHSCRSEERRSSS